MRRFSLMFPVLLLVLAGCRHSVPPQNAQMALQRVNDNVLRIDQPLQCKGWVSFKFRDADGKMHRFAPHDHSLIYRSPQFLRFDVRSTLAGDVAQFGSNAEHYWIWIDVSETRKLWIGSWAGAGAGTSRRLVIPPNELLDALMLRPLPPAAAGGPLPELQRRGFNYWLVYQRATSDPRSPTVREVRLDRCEPYQPREIIDRLADGRIAMHAKLDSYRSIGPGGPLTPRRYVVQWPLDEAELRLDVHQAAFRPDLDLEVFASPLEWQGEIEHLDGPAFEGSDRAAGAQGSP